MTEQEAAKFLCKHFPDATVSTTETKTYTKSNLTQTFCEIEISTTIRVRTYSDNWKSALLDILVQTGKI